MFCSDSEIHESGFRNLFYSSGGSTSASDFSDISTSGELPTLFNLDTRLLLSLAMARGIITPQPKSNPPIHRDVSVL